MGTMTIFPAASKASPLILTSLFQNPPASSSSRTISVPPSAVILAIPVALASLPGRRRRQQHHNKIIPARDRVIDMGKYRGEMLGSLPSSYLKWVSSNLRAGDTEEWAKLADQVLGDPVYRDRIEWEHAEKVLNGNAAFPTSSPFSSGSSAVAELLELSERFGWDNEDKQGWSKIDFGLLGTSLGGRIPRLLPLPLESNSRYNNSNNGGSNLKNRKKEETKAKGTSTDEEEGGDEGGRRRERRARMRRRRLQQEEADGSSAAAGTTATISIRRSRRWKASSLQSKVEKVEEEVDINGELNSPLPIVILQRSPFPGRRALLSKVLLRHPSANATNHLPN